MYVIQGTLPATTFGANLVTDVFILPADACVWQVSPDASGGYTLSNVYYVQGTTETLVSNAQLGHVGKSGRFVKSTV